MTNDLVSIRDKVRPSSSLLEILILSVLFGSLTSIAPLLLSIINSSLRHDCVLSDFKYTKVTQLLTKPQIDASSPSSLFQNEKENIFENQFRSLLCTLQISDHFQSVFQKQRAIETALLMISIMIAIIALCWHLMQKIALCSYCLTSVLFLILLTIIFYLICISYHLYADDILSTLVDCSSWISDWISSNCLVLNSDKTEAIILECHSP